MKYPMLLAAGAAVLALGACEREVRIEKKAQVESGDTLKTISRLDCPEKEGDLTRVSAAADGLSCAYAAKDAEVTLRLVALNGGDAGQALAPIEAELRKLVPTPGARVIDTAKGAQVTLPGIDIKADDSGAKIRIGGLEVNADDDGAEVRHKGKGDGVRSTFVLTSDKAGDYNTVGYEARGPQAGPLVVAVLKAKGGHDGDDVFDDVKDLVERNAGD